MGELHAARGLGGRYNGWDIVWEYCVSDLVVVVVIRARLMVSSCSVLSLLGVVITSGHDAWVSYSGGEAPG